jgi:pSer/pThr/pTyr-binding forkhead associated (FHA) protein
VGRSREADLQVKDGRVSGRHCSLSLDPATRTVLVHDQGSTNGTFVDGERVDEATLTTGSTLRIGGSSWRVELDQVTP